MSLPDRIRLDQVQVWDHHEQSDQEGDHQVTFPDRPTLLNFSLARSSPFRRYIDPQTCDTWSPNPFPVFKRLGLSEDAFDARLTSEIDSMLVASAENRHKAKEPISDPLPAREAPPALPSLSKEDCLSFFRVHGYPSSSSPGLLLGMYWWVADLGRSRFNFDIDFDKDDLSILDAYD